MFPSPAAAATSSTTRFTDDDDSNSDIYFIYNNNNNIYRGSKNKYNNNNHNNNNNNNSNKKCCCSYYYLPLVTTRWPYCSVCCGPVFKNGWMMIYFKQGQSHDYPTTFLTLRGLVKVKSLKSVSLKPRP